MAAPNPMNPFDELLDQLGPAAQVPPAQTPKPDPAPAVDTTLFEKATQAIERRTVGDVRNVRQAEVDGAKLQGDRASMIQTLSTRLGIPPQQIEQNYDAYVLEDRQKQSSASQLATSSPRLASWVSNDPYKLAASREDLNDMTILERTFQVGSNVFGAIGAGSQQFAAGVWGLLQLKGELTGDYALAEFARGTSEVARGLQETSRGDQSGMGLVERGIYSGIESVTAAAPSMLLALTGAGAPVALGTMGATTTGSSYSSARAEGVAPGRALTYGAVQGIIEVATEKIPMSRMLADIGKRTPLVQMIVHQVAPEITGENVATVLQDLNDWSTLPSNQNKTFKDYLAERPSAAALTTISTLTMIGLNTAMAHSASRLLDDVTKASENSKLRERSPEQFAALVDHLAQDSPASTLYARAADWVTYWQSKDLDPKTEAIKLTGDPAAYDAALASGGDIAIPMGQYAAHLAPTEHNTYFSKELRVTPDMPNVREAAEAEAQTADLMTAIQESVELAAQRREAPEATSSPLRAALVAQTLADPGFQTMVAREQADADTVANVYAAGVEAVIGNLARRAGEDPLDIVARHGLSIGAEGTAAALRAVQAAQAPAQAPLGAAATETPAEGETAPPGAQEPAQEPAEKPPVSTPPDGQTLAQGPGPELPVLAVAPARVSNGRLVLSTRVPFAVGAPAMTDVLKTNAEVAYGRPKLMKAIANKTRPMRQLTDAERAGDDIQVAETLVNRMARNLRWLHDAYPKQLRDRAKLWYVGAHRIAGELAATYDTSREQATAVLAVLSPQKDWFQNVSLAERVMDLYNKSERDNPVFSEALFTHYADRVRQGLPARLRAIEKREGPEAAQAERAATVAKLRWQKQTLTGRTWRDLQTLDQAILLRAIDETTNKPSYRVILPEGERGDLARTQKGEPQKVTWGTYEFIANAISVMRDGSVETINQRVGREHKVRSFFNNISDPWDDTSVTIDTHAVAAALLEPTAGRDPEVKLAMSGPGDLLAGISGTNPLYAEAYFRVADELGILPRELQSIVWEAVRGLYGTEHKKAGAPVRQRVLDLWQQHSGGTVSEEDVRGRLIEIAGGIARPAWADTAPRVAFDEGILRRGDVLPGDPGVPAGRGDTREGATGTAGRRTKLNDGPVVPRPDKLAEGRKLPILDRTTAATRALDRFRDGGVRLFEGSRDRGAGAKRAVDNVESVWTPNGEFADAFAEAGFGTPTLFELKPTKAGAKEFHRLIVAAKGKIADGAQVYVYPVEDYRTMRLFATSDGNAGFAIKSDGDIVSVFNHNTGKERIANAMLALAVQNGGTKLDCFDTTLPHVYAINGFKVVKRDPWNEEYKPEGWNKERFARFNNGEPDVVYMEYDPVSLKTGPVTLYQDPVAAPTTASWYYSRVTKAVELAKQEKASGRDWKNIIKGSKLGVNADEFALTAVSDLEDGRSYMRQEVLDYLQVNAVAVTIHTMGDFAPTREEIRERAEALHDEKVQEKLEEVEDRYPIEVPYEEVEERELDEDEIEEGGPTHEYLVYGETFESLEEAEKFREERYYELVDFAEQERANDVRSSISMYDMEAIAEEELQDEIASSGRTVKYAEWQLDAGYFAEPDSYREVFVQAASEQRHGFAALTPEENALFTSENRFSAMPNVRKELRAPAESITREQILDRWIDRWTELLPRRNDRDRTKLQRDIDVLKKLKAAGAENAVWQGARWQDGHSEYDDVDNPIVRLRFNIRHTQQIVREKRELNQEVMEKGIAARERIRELQRELGGFNFIERGEGDFAIARHDNTARPITPEEFRELFTLREQREAAEQEMKNAQALTAKGPRILFLEELQPPAAGEEHFDKMPELYRKNWREIGLKYALRYAAENNLQGVAWTNGTVQVDRYSLEKVVEKIDWTPATGPNGRTVVTLHRPKRNMEGQHPFILVVDEAGIVVEAENIGMWEGRELKDIVGEKIAAQVAGASSGEIESEDLKVGGSGLRKLYDVDIPNVANKLPALKKAGVKVTTTRIESRSERASESPFIPMTPELQATVMGGQTLFQEEGQQRGAIDLAPGMARIRFLADADLSTFLHETGHLYLHVMTDVVSKVRVGDPATWSAGQRGLVEDYDRVLKWLGVASPDQIGKDQHERFAKGFEAYLMAGKAPAPEMASAFSRYRSWLTKIYRTLQTLGVDLSPEITGVFDRLVASEDAIARAKQEARIVPVFSTPEQAGMSPIEWQGYQRILQTAHRQAEDALAARVAEELSRERSAWWKAKKQSLARELTEQYKQTPVYRALAYLQRGELPNGNEVEGALKLSKDSIVEKFGKDRLKTLPLPYVYQVDGGQDVDAAAELLGFTSGDELLNALAASEKLEDVVKRDVEARMNAEFGNMRIDGTLRVAARQAVEENGFQEVLEAELKAIAKAARAARSIVTAAKAQVTAEDDSARRAMRRALTQAATPAEVLNQQAEKTIAAIAPKDIKPQLYWQAAQRESTSAARAVAAGRYEDAVAAKTKQRTAVALHRAALNAIQEAEAIEKYAHRMGEKGAQARLGKAGESYQSQVNALLNKFEFSDVTNKALEKRKTLAEWIADRQREGLPIDLPADVLEASQRRNFRTVPMELLREVRDAIKQIDNLARLKNELLASKDKRTYDDRRDQLVANIRAKNDIREGELEFRRADERKHLVADWFGSMQKIATLAQQLDGFVDGGPMWDLVIRPLNDAADREVTRRQTEGKKYDEILRRHYPGRSLGEWSKKTHIPAIGASLSKEARLAVALNWGNETSRDRILSDPKRRWDRRQVEAILDTLDERDWRFVQDTWDYIDSFWPEISDKQFRLTGLRPEKVEGLPVETKYGRLRGGYYPLKYDARLAPSPGTNDLVGDAKLSLQAAYIRATTKRGHTKARLDHVELPVRLELGVMFEHLDQVIHDLTHHEALIDVSRLLRDSKVSSAIHDVGGDVMFRQFTNALTDIAIGKRPGGNVMDKAAGFMKTGTQVAALGFNLWTAAQQPLGLFNGAARVGPKWVARGMFRWMRDASTMENTLSWIRDVSPFMAARSLTANQDINDLRNRLSEPGGWFDALVRQVSGDKVTQQNVTDSFLWHIGLMQRVADVPTWLGMYEKAKAVGKNDADAIALADQAVRDSQGSGQIVDLSQVQRGGPIARLFMVFYSYGNTVYNATARAYGQTEFSNPVSVARFLGNLSLLYAFPAVGAVALSRLFGMTSGDEDDPLADWLKDIATEMGASALNTMVFVRELGGLLRSSNRGYQGPAGTRLLQQVYNLGAQVSQGVVDEGLLKSLNATAGVIFRYPAAQAQRTVDGFVALQSGETDNPLALLFGPTRE